MNATEKLIQLCVKSLKEKNIYVQPYQDRLKNELKEVIAQDKQEYFLNLQEENFKDVPNENNLLIPFLLGICPDFDIKKESAYTVGENPDIDVDFLPEVADYLRNDFIPKTFGQECVCNIGTYGTLGFKAALLDMARVFGKDRNEVLEVTKSLKLKDDEGTSLNWEQAIEKNPAFKTYAQNNPEVVEAASKMLNRNRSSGQHAAGIIISNVKISDYMPLIRGKEGFPASAWTEGQHAQDLSKVGFVKFDILSIDALEKIGYACKRIRERHPEVKSICAMPGGPDWSDLSYLEDPKCIEAANNGDLKMIFQFDSEGIRALAKMGGVSSFEDLVAYTALYRPGTMESGLHETFCKRKRGEEKYEIHPLLEPILGSTYGVACYQENVMMILNVAGKIPLKDCYAVIKAISKKNVSKFAKYKEIFVENSQKTLGLSEDKAREFWDQIEAWSGYGFNASHAVAYTYYSWRQLWLKVHYPIEYWEAVLHATKTADERINEYKREGNKKGIIVERVDLNISKEDFCIHDEKIYYGFSKIKGIGEDMARRIVEGQPYSGFVDFLQRFGTEAKIVQALIGLKCFEKDGDPVFLYKFYEHYKDMVKKRNNRLDRYNATKEKYEKIFDEFSPNRDWMENLEEKYQENPKEWKEIRAAKNKYDKLTATFNAREQEFLEDLPTLESFKEKAHKFYISEDLEEIFLDPVKSEITYYGFVWQSALEKCSDYHGLTFEKFRTEDLTTGPVEVEVLESIYRVAKNGKTTYWDVKVTDGGEEQIIRVWGDEFDRFSECFKPGALIRAQVSPPNNGFRTWNLKPIPWNMRNKIRAEDDARVVKLILDKT